MDSLSSAMKEESAVADHQSEANAGQPTRRTVWGLTAGITVIAVTGVGFAILTAPWVGVVWGLALIVLAPSSSRLDRRLALNLSLILGLVPLALYVPPVLGSRTAGIATLAIATGATVAAAVMRPANLVPTAYRRDGLILLAGLLAGLTALPLRSPGSPERALAMLSTGIDNSYHYAMFLEQRLTAPGSSLLSANADGSGFAFDDYPQWFHRLLTVLAQIGIGDPGTAPTELVRYAQLQWLVFAALAVLVSSALLQSLPKSAPSSLLVPTFAILFSLLLGVPGALNLLQGHLSFLVAACAPLVIFLIALPQPRPRPGLFVILGGLVLVTASWMLLLPMAGAALLPPALDVWRRQQRMVRWSALAGLGLAVTAAFVLFVLGPLTHGGLAAVLRDGTVPRVGLPTMLPVLAGSVVLLGVLCARRRDVRLSGHLILALAALAQTLVLGGFMLSTTGQLTYYFWKLGLGSLVVTIIVTAHAIVMIRTAGGSHPHGGRLRLIPATAVVLVAALGLGSVLQNFAAPSAGWAVFLSGSLEARASTDGAGDVDLVLRLAASLDPHDAARTRLLATRPADMNAAHASEWFHALSHSSTRRAVSVDDGVYKLALDRSNIHLAVELARSTLSVADGRVLVTDPKLYAAILAVTSPAEESRVSLVS